MDRRQNRNRAMLTEPIAVTLLVVDTLEDLGVPYFIGGSLATAVHGVARATLDLSYLREWAARLGVTDLLKRALGAVDNE